MSIVCISVMENAPFFGALAREIDEQHGPPVRVAHISREAFAWRERIEHEVTSNAMVVVWGGYTEEQRHAISVATMQGKPVIYLENGLLPNTFQCDTGGVNARSDRLRRWVSIRGRMRIEQMNLVGIYDDLRSSVESRGGLMPSGLPSEESNFIFFPLQVHDDSQLRDNSPHFRSLTQAVVTTARVATMLGRPLVLKEHPKEHSAPIIAALWRILPASVLIYSANTSLHVLLERCSAVVTINSTVGIEAMAYQKNIVVLGTSCYAHNLLTDTAEGEEPLLRALNVVYTDSYLARRHQERAWFLSYLKQAMVPSTVEAVAERIINTYGAIYHEGAG